MGEYKTMSSIIRGKLFDKEDLVKKLGEYNRDHGNLHVESEYWLTDNNRLIGCTQTREQVSFLKFDYQQTYCMYDLNTLNPDHVSLYKSSDYTYDLTFTLPINGITTSITIVLNSIAIDAKSILQEHVKKYAKKIKTELKSSPVNDIRKLYEDGLITKEEMLDLIKSLKL